MDKRLSDSTDLEDINFSKDHFVESTQENISILSVVEVSDNESKFLKTCKFNKYISSCPVKKKKKSCLSFSLVNGKLKNVSSINVQPNKKFPLTSDIRNQQGCYKSDLKRKKIVHNYSTINEADAVNFQKINSKKLGSFIPKHFKSNFSDNEDNKRFNKCNEKMAECQSDDETLTELPKKIFVLISESIVKCTLCFKHIKLLSMRQHYRTHTGVKPFKCQFCANRFTRNADLHRHIISLHPRRGPLNLQCLVCEKNFIDRKSLICHLKNHNSALYFICHICGHKFKHKTYYQNHLKFVHSLSTDVNCSVVYKLALKQMKELQAKEYKKKIEVAEHEQSKSGQVLEDSSDEDCNNLTIKEEPYEILSDSYNSELDVEICSPVNTSETTVSNPSPPLASSFRSLFDPINDRTLNLVQKEMKLGISDEEELISKAIAEHVIQAETTLEHIQLSLNKSASALPLKYQQTKNREINYDIAEQNKLINEPKSSEIHISASVDGKVQKFILRVPSGRLIDATTQKGMEILVNLVRDLYAGKGELNSNIDVTLHHNIA